jgi:hydroxymethylpyrimidine/phosphomethylpyrimidine kinase
VALTVAGSDSGGGAGIQADLITFRALGVFGTSAITCITAQNPDRVSAIQPIKPGIVAEQMDRVFEAFRLGGAKTGMLYDAAIIEVVADGFARRKFRRLVVDPVMVASSGALLLKQDAIAALTRRLLPLAAVVTPNLAEAEVLSEQRIRSLAELRDVARALAERFGVPVLVKGGHLPSIEPVGRDRRARRVVGQTRLARRSDPTTTRAVDVLFDGRQFHEFDAPVVRGIKTHGTGCTLSAAIAANLALGQELVPAVRAAKKFVTRAIRQSLRIGRYRALRI